MSDDFDDLDEQDNLDGDERFARVPRKTVRDLEKRAKAGDASTQELAGLRRELAFAQAGIGTDDPRLAYFRKGYDGEMTSDAIRTAAIDSGFLAANDADRSDADEMAAHRRLSDASAGNSRSSNDLEETLVRAQKAAQAAPRGMEAAAYAAVYEASGIRMRHPQ